MNVKEIHNLLQTRKTAFFDKLRYKTVAIVGRAHYLSTIKQRALIESHDVIVRVHGPFIHNFKSIDQTPYIGKRTDIYVSRLWWQGKEMIEQMVKEQRQHNFIMVAENFYEMQSSITNWRLLEKDGVPIHVVPMEFYMSLSMSLGFAHPLPGTIMTAYIQVSQASQIYVTGCACYQEEAPDSMALPHYIEAHNCYADSHFMKDLIANDSRYSCDDIMNRELGKTQI